MSLIFSNKARLCSYQNYSLSARIRIIVDPYPLVILKREANHVGRPVLYKPIVARGEKQCTRLSGDFFLANAAFSRSHLLLSKWKGVFIKFIFAVHFTHFTISFARILIHFKVFRVDLNIAITRRLTGVSLIPKHWQEPASIPVPAASMVVYKA